MSHPGPLTYRGITTIRNEHRHINVGCVSYSHKIVLHIPTNYFQSFLSIWYPQRGIEPRSSVMKTDVIAFILLRMVSDVCQVQHLKLELADGYRSLYYNSTYHFDTICTSFIKSCRHNFCFTNLKYQLLKILF